MYLCGQLFLGVVHRVGHMINWCFNERLILHQGLLLLYDFLKPCNHIAHHVCVVHARVFHSEVVVFLDFSVCCPKKLFEPNPHSLDCCHAILFANYQYKLDRPVNNCLSYVHSLVLSVKSSGYVRELNKLSNGQ